MVRKCWRGKQQVQLLCAGLLKDLCEEEAHVRQVVSSGAIAVFLHLDRQIQAALPESEAQQFSFLVRHGISEPKAQCAAALNRLEAHTAYRDIVQKERRIQDRISLTLDMLERDHQLKLTPLMEEAIRMVPRSFFAPQAKVPLFKKRIFYLCRFRRRKHCRVPKLRFSTCLSNCLLYTFIFSSFKLFSCKRDIVYWKWDAV